MTRGEMLLKVVMSPSEPIPAFVEQFNKLLSDAESSEFIKVLDMKGVRKVDQSVYIEQFNSLNGSSVSIPPNSQISSPSAKNVNMGEEEESRIKKLEKMIRKKLWIFMYFIIFKSENEIQRMFLARSWPIFWFESNDFSHCVRLLSLQGARYIRDSRVLTMHDVDRYIKSIRLCTSDLRSYAKHKLAWNFWLAVYFLEG